MAALYIDTRNDDDDIQIANTIFDQNEGGSSVVYLEGFSHPFITQQIIAKYSQPVIINNSSSTNIVATAMYLSDWDVKFLGIVLYVQLKLVGQYSYASQETRMTIEDEPTVTFIANTARQDGEAIM